MFLPLEVFGEADGDHRLALVTRTDHAPQGQCVLFRFPWARIIDLSQDDMKTDAVCSPGLASAKGRHPQHVPQPAVVALPPSFSASLGSSRAYKSAVM
ncbi:MAG TPA: hypothetical protein VIK64_07160, partial [Anaerolineales bacterium]